MRRKILHLNILEMIFLMPGNLSLRCPEVDTHTHAEYILSFYRLWRVGEYATPQHATLASRLFWAEGNWEKADLGQAFSPPPIYLKTEHKFLLWGCFPITSSPISRISIRKGTALTQRQDGTKSLHTQILLPNQPLFTVRFPIYLPSHNLLPVEAQSLFPFSSHFSTILLFFY